MLHFIDTTASASGTLVCKVFGLGGLALDQLLLAGVGRVTVHTLLIAMEQIGQRVLVMHVGRRDHGAVRQRALAVHADVQLHAKVPLLGLIAVVHLGITRLVGVVGGAGRSNDGRIDNGGSVDLEAACLQLLAHLGKQGLCQFVVVESSGAT